MFSRLTMQSSPRLLSFLRQSEHGSVVAEFAICAFMTVFLIMGIVEYCLVFYGASVLEGAVNAGAQAGKAGLHQPYVSNVIHSRVGGLLNPAAVHITTTAYADTNAVAAGHGAPDSTGNRGEFVKYEASYDWPVATPFLQPFLQNVSGKRGIFRLYSTIMVQND